MKTIKIIIEQTRTGYSAHEERITVYTTGKTIPSTLRNMAEAWELYEKVDEVKPVSKSTRKNPFGYKPGVKRNPVRR